VELEPTDVVDPGVTHLRFRVRRSSLPSRTG
jgi:hypothetical protein